MSGGNWLRKALGVVSLLLAVLVPAVAQLTQSERKGLDDALYIGNMTEDDLGYEKKVSDDPYRLALNIQALDHPLDAADALMALHSKGRGTLAQVLAAGCHDVFGDSSPSALQPTGSPSLPPELPEPLRQPLTTMIVAIADSNASIRQATHSLTPAERRELIEGLPQWAAGSSLVRLSFVKAPQADPKRLLSLLKRVDLRAIRDASVRLARFVESELPRWRSLAKTVPLTKKLHFLADGVIVEISGQEDDVHDSRDTNLCIDLGGRNHYTGRYGAGVGYASVLIDGGGENSFDVPDLSIGSGVLGVGLAYELGTGTVLDGKSLCFGCGIAGVGAMYREAGNSQFRSVALAQGFGMFGAGLLLCAGGNDTFDASLFGQGAARTGGLGWLVNAQGRDTYRAGGLALGSGAGKLYHLSNSQGFASGFWINGILVSGGLGLLTNLGGDNLYKAEIGCQAAAVAGGVGSLSNEAGGNSLTADLDAQSLADHQAASFLFSLGGNDSFVTHQGACHAFGSDFSVAFLLARESHDVFAARDSRPGAGSANGLGIFLAANGENTYVGRPAAGFPARGSGSLGIFCELGGGNKYADGLTSGQARVDAPWAIAFDASSGTGEAPDVPVRPNAPKPGSIPSPGAAVLTTFWERARGGGAEGMDAVSQMIGVGKPAVEYLLGEHLKDRDLGNQRVIAAVIRGVGGDGRAALAAKIQDADDETALNAMRIAMDCPGAGFGAAVVACLKRASTQRLAAELAGVAAIHEAVPDLMTLTASGDKLLARASMIALARIGDEASVGTASAFVTSSDLPMRQAAIELIAKFPSGAVATASGLLSTGDEQKQRTAIRILGLVGTPEALGRISKMLAGQGPGVTIEALVALNGRFPDSARTDLTALQSSPNPLVRAVAHGVVADR